MTGEDFEREAASGEAHSAEGDFGLEHVGLAADDAVGLEDVDGDGAGFAVGDEEGLLEEGLAAGADV